MNLEELTQEDLDMLVKMGEQRGALAAILTNVMNAEATSDDALLIKRHIMMSMTIALALGAVVKDNIDKILLQSMKDHCEEQISINDLLNEI